MEWQNPLAVTLIVLTLTLLIVSGAAASLGILAAYLPGLRPWLDEQLRRLFKRG